MKLLLPVAAMLFLLHTACAQPGDFIVVKKNGQTFKTFFTGAFITFRTNNGEWFSSKITGIKNDSLFFREVVVQRVPTPWGVSRLDTMTSFIRRVHYKDISAVPKKNESFRFVKNGTLFMLGGGGYLFLNAVNSAYLHYSILGKKNLPSVLGAAGAFGIGYLMKKLYKPYLLIGKKHTIQYINVKTP